MAYGQYIPAWSGEEISDILHLPDPMWQESWGKVELLLVMRIDEPKFLVCYREATLVFESFKQLYTCSHLPFIHLLPNPLYKLLLKTCNEEKGTMNELMSIKECRTSIELFERLIHHCGKSRGVRWNFCL